MKSASVSFPGVRARVIPDGDQSRSFEAEGTASVSFESGFEVKVLGQDEGKPQGSADTAASGA